jgi:hypothetical protein
MTDSGLTSAAVSDEHPAPRRSSLRAEPVHLKEHGRMFDLPPPRAARDARRTRLPPLLLGAPERTPDLAPRDPSVANCAGGGHAEGRSTRFRVFRMIGT